MSILSRFLTPDCAASEILKQLLSRPDDPNRNWLTCYTLLVAALPSFGEFPSARGAAWLAAGRPGEWTQTKTTLFLQSRNPKLDSRYQRFLFAIDRRLQR